MAKGAINFIHIAIIVSMMALSVPILLLLVNYINKSSHPYIADKTLVNVMKQPELVANADGTKYQFIRQGINLKAEDIMFSYLIFDEYSPAETYNMRIQNRNDDTYSQAYDMTNPNLRVNKYDSFPRVYDEYKFRHLGSDSRWFLIWDSEKKSWVYSTKYPKNY